MLTTGMTWSAIDGLPCTIIGFAFLEQRCLGQCRGRLETIAIALADSPPLTRLASDDARRPLPASGER